MAITKQQVISQFLRTYPDMAAQAEEYFIRAYRRLLGEAEVVREWVEASLTAGIRDTVLPREIIEIDQVVVAVGGSAAEGWQGQTLSPVFDEAPPGYSLRSEGGQWKIRLLPAPRQGTDGSGFPKLAVFGCFWSAPADADPLPETLLDPSLLTSRMKEYASEDLDPASASFYRQEADRKTSELKAWLTERIGGERGSIRAAWTLNARRTL